MSSKTTRSCSSSSSISVVVVVVIVVVVDGAGARDLQADVGKLIPQIPVWFKYNASSLSLSLS